MRPGATHLLVCLGVALVAAVACGGSGANPVVTSSDGGGGSSGSGGSSAGDDASSSGSNPAPGDASAPSGYPAPHPSPPQVISLGGPVIAPTIVPITWTGDPFAADIDAFTAKVGASAWWAAVTAEYGAGTATSAAPVHVQTAAPATIDDTAIQQFIKSNVGGLLPAAKQGMVYAFFYPAGTTVTWYGAASCAQNEGYHWDLAIDATTKVSYVVVPRCDTAVGAPGITGIDAMTLVASHEYVEAATDPFPTLAPAYGALDPAHTIWGVLEDVEIGDLCTWVQGVTIKPPDLGYVVQRIWSNAAITAGHDPCIPAPQDEVYFNSVPVLGDDVSVTSYGQPTTTKGLSIPVGQTRTVDVVLYSDGPTGGPWTLTAADAPSYGIPPGTHNLSLVFDPPQGRNGDHVKLTITVNAYDPQTGAAPFMITSTLGQRQNTWFGLAGK